MHCPPSGNSSYVWQNPTIFKNCVNSCVKIVSILTRNNKERLDQHPQSVTTPPPPAGIHSKAEGGGKKPQKTHKKPQAGAWLLPGNDKGLFSGEDQTFGVKGS